MENMINVRKTKNFLVLFSAIKVSSLFPPNQRPSITIWKFVPWECHFSNQNIISVFYRFTGIIVEKVLTNQSAWFPSCVKKLRIIKSSTFQPNASTNPF